MKVFIDSDILIWHLRGKTEAKELLKNLIKEDASDLWIGAMQRAEIVFSCKSMKKKARWISCLYFKPSPLIRKLLARPEDITGNGILHME